MIKNYKELMAGGQIRSMEDLLLEFRAEILEWNGRDKWPAYEATTLDKEKHGMLYRLLHLEGTVDFGRFCVIVKTLLRD
jgi:hypothetical protein